MRTRPTPLEIQRAVIQIELPEHPQGWEPAIPEITDEMIDRAFDNDIEPLDID